jgi:hypothetical protein
MRLGAGWGWRNRPPNKFSALQRRSLVRPVRGYDRMSLEFLLLSNITKGRGAGNKLGILGATTFGERGDGTRRYKISARGRWLRGGIGWVVPQPDNELDGITNVRVGPIRINL